MGINRSIIFCIIHCFEHSNDLEHLATITVLMSWAKRRLY